MHLRSLSDQIVAIGRDDITTFRKDETIWTESSYKFRVEDIVSMAERSGFRCEAQLANLGFRFREEPNS